MAETVYPATPGTTLPGAVLLTPTVTLVDGTENLRITAQASVASTVTTYVRIRRSDGTVEPMFDTLVVPGTRVVTSKDMPIGAGTILNILAYPTSGAPRVGELFVQVMLVRGVGASSIPQALLSQDYATARQPVAWPGSPLRRSTEGQGALRTIANHSQTGGPNQVVVPAGCRWRLDTIMLELNTVPSATADRIARFALIDGGLGKNKAWAQSPVGQPNGVIKQYMIMAGSGSIDDSSSSVVILAGPGPVTLVSGDIIYFDCTNVDSLDTLWIYGQAEEFLEFA